MRQITLFLVCIFAALLPLWSVAQGNLQFNQVRKMQFSFTTPQNTNNLPYNYVMGPYVVTVPVGKVLKIESLNVSRVRQDTGFVSMNLANYLGWDEPAMLFLEETVVFGNPQYFGGVGGTLPHSIIWLPDGTHNFYIGGVGCPGLPATPCARSYSAMITGIEFNVVP